MGTEPKPLRRIATRRESDGFRTEALAVNRAQGEKELPRSLPAPKSPLSTAADLRRKQEGEERSAEGASLSQNGLSRSHWVWV